MNRRELLRGFLASVCVPFVPKAILEKALEDHDYEGVGPLILDTSERYIVGFDEMTDFTREIYVPPLVAIHHFAMRSDNSKLAVPVDLYLMRGNESTIMEVSVNSLQSFSWHAPFGGEIIMGNSKLVVRGTASNPIRVSFVAIGRKSRSPQ